MTTCGRSVAGVAGELADQIEPGEVGHQVVDNQHVEEALTEQASRLVRIGGRDHLVALAAQCGSQRVENLGLVVDEQDCAGRHHLRTAAGVWGCSNT